MKIRIQNFIYYLFIIVVYMNFQIEAKEVTQLNEKPYVVIKSYVLSEKDEKKAFESAILEKKKISKNNNIIISVLKGEKEFVELNYFTSKNFFKEYLGFEGKGFYEFKGCFQKKCDFKGYKKNSFLLDEEALKGFIISMDFNINQYTKNTNRGTIIITSYADSEEEYQEELSTMRLKYVLEVLNGMLKYKKIKILTKKVINKEKSQNSQSVEEHYNNRKIQVEWIERD